MKNSDLEQNISGAFAPGRGLSSAPWNNYNNAYLISKKEQNVKNEQNGRSMIEMLGVLAIIGVLSVGGIAGYSKAMQRYRINKTIEQITLIAGNARAFFAPQGNYKGLSCYSCDGENPCYSNAINAAGYDSYRKDGCQVVKKAKIFPDEMITLNNKGEIINIDFPIGEFNTLGTANKSSQGDKKAFEIFFTLPYDHEICIELASYDWTIAGARGLEIMNDEQNGKSYLTFPVSVEDAVTACSKVIDTNYLDFMLWTMYFDVNSNCWSETNGNECS